ncbi:MAG: hypothetical protein ABIE94_04815 [archaeon]
MPVKARPRITEDLLILEQEGELVARLGDKVYNLVGTMSLSGGVGMCRFCLTKEEWTGTGIDCIDFYYKHGQYAVFASTGLMPGQEGIPKGTQQLGRWHSDNVSIDNQVFEELRVQCGYNRE